VYFLLTSTAALASVGTMRAVKLTMEKQSISSGEWATCEAKPQTSLLTRDGVDVATFFLVT